jgi:FKBP-type peptidyl-prolyl cis-trans isomerase FkpA
MKRVLIVGFLFLMGFNGFANYKDSIVYYSLPDSVKAVSFLAEFSVAPFQSKNELDAGIQTSLVKLKLEADKQERKIEFEFPENAKIVAYGIGVSAEKGELSWSLNWDPDEKYKLMIATAGDSAGNFSLYSGYIFLPKEKKWKLIGTCKIEGQWGTLKQPAVFHSVIKKTPVRVTVNEAWCQRQNGSWKNMLQQNFAPPVVNLLSHVDSVEQVLIDKKIIAQAVTDSKTDAKLELQNVYYSILKEGTGRQVSVNDTVAAIYKGYLLNDGSVFDETKEKPATFPLRRLITGWQIGVPLCKVGGKIKIVIPSNLAYSIRTRAAKIPPNSILVFEIEVVDAKGSY